MRNFFCLGVAFALSVLVAPGVNAETQYQLARKFTLGGDGGWDYVTYDPVGERLFIARATRVQVVDPVSGRLIAEIPGTVGVHGIALAQDLGKGFTSNGRDNTVTVFDLKTLQEIVKLGLDGAENPDAIVYDPVSKRVITLNGRSHTATAIDAAADKIVGTIPLDGKPEFAVADGTGLIYVNIEDKNEQQAIDARSARVTATWPLDGCEEPSGLAIDQQHRRLFAGCHNKVMAIVSVGDRKVIATLPIGAGVDATGFDPVTQLAFSSNGDGTLTVVHEDDGNRFTVAQNAVTERGARTLALNPGNHEVYLVTAEFQEEPPATGQTRLRRTMKPDSFALLVMGAK